MDTFLPPTSPDSLLMSAVAHLQHRVNLIPLERIWRKNMVLEIMPSGRFAMETAV